MMDIDVLYSSRFTDPEPILAMLREVLFDQAIIADINLVEVESEDQAEELDFLGSPTIRVDGIDVESGMSFGHKEFGIRARTYMVNGEESNIPGKDMVVETVEVGHLAELNMLGRCC